ncbi:MAG: helix-turn-helix domain-containing protein [Halothiobacillus sp.]|nr:helix-turn-helix domain-containing protein [Halothiobacillus sp.]
MNISNRLKDAIELQGLKISDAATRCGIPYRSMQNYLRGEREPNVEAIIKIATHLGISMDWLLTGEGSMYRAAPTAQIPSLSTREEAVLAMFRSLDEDAQREIQQVAEEKKRLRDVERQIKELQALLPHGKRSA